MAEDQDHAETVDDEVEPVEREVARSDPDGERVEGGTERAEHLTDDPTPIPAEEAADHVESQ